LGRAQPLHSTASCQVVELDFPKGGWLDNDHFDPADLDDNGDANFEDDEGREFGINIIDN